MYSFVLNKKQRQFSSRSNQDILVKQRLRNSSCKIFILSFRTVVFYLVPHSALTIKDHIHIAHTFYCTSYPNNQRALKKRGVKCHVHGHIAMQITRVRVSGHQPFGFYCGVADQPWLLFKELSIRVWAPASTDLSPRAAGVIKHCVGQLQRLYQTFSVDGEGWFLRIWSVLQENICCKCSSPQHIDGPENQ